jgi:hypothetical protein
MDFNKVEIEALKETTEQLAISPVELTELQLVMVGGGSGEVTPY